MVSRDPLVGLGEGDPVPARHDHVRGGAEPEGEVAGRRLGHGGHALGQEGRAPGVGGDDGHAELQ